MLNSCGKPNDEKDDYFYGYEQKSESTTEKMAHIIDGQDVSFESFEMHIPEEYSLKDNGNSLRIENENNSFNISIEEHKYTDDNFEQYISEKIKEYIKIGAEVSELKAVTIGDYDMQRVKISFMPMQAYGYFVNQKDEAVLIMLVSNGKEMMQEEADTVLEQITYYE